MYPSIIICLLALLSVSVGPCSALFISNGIRLKARAQSFSISACAPEENVSEDEETITFEQVEPEILIPFPEAANPDYINKGPVGEGRFIVQRIGGPTEEELSDQNILKIVKLQCTDLEVNTLVWKCLGYRFNEKLQHWENNEVFPKWRQRYPEPPDLIGMQRTFQPTIDEPSFRANQALVRSVPTEYKQSLKTKLRPLGFKGYSYKGLTPNMTRRAQCANWILYYREALFGVPLEELQRRKEARKAAQAQDKDWKPPLKEVF